MSEVNSDSENLYARLKRVFHEPNRLAIMSALAATESGLTFTELKKGCDLTDGNLSRHLKTLEDAGLIAVNKTFVGVKPQTTVKLSVTGRDDFVEYLNALASVLLKASEALEASSDDRADAALTDAAKA